MSIYESKRIYVRLVEQVLGHPLPVGVVHHVDENRANNANSNLVILQDVGEHNALHRRLRILRAGGNPWTQQICCTCRSIKNLNAFPRQTNSRYQAERRGECRQCTAARGAKRHQLKTGLGRF